MTTDSQNELLSLKREWLRVRERQWHLQCRRSLEAWCIEALSPFGQEPARHHRLLIEKLEAIDSGEIDRLMVLMPPNSAKSTYVSVLFAAWFLSRKPNRQVIGASHGADLAEEFSGRILKLLKDNRGVAVCLCRHQCLREVAG